MATDRQPRAVVTGGASGIGAGAVRRLQAMGAAVTAVDIDAAGLDAMAGDGVTPLVADLADPTDRAKVVDAGAGCDYLVQAAGIIRLKHIGDFTVDDWRDVFSVNAESVFFLCQGIGPTMPAGSAIVNLSSVAAKFATTTEASIYAASKTAVLSITRSFAYALASIPVRVNALCPGIIDTPMQDAVLDQVAALRGTTREGLSRQREASVPLGRSASPDEIAELIAFLVSDRAGYITGQAINFDGGFVTW